MQIIKAEIITIGDEILYGQITDTNSQFIATELDKIGIQIARRTSVGDDRDAILDALTVALKIADIVIFTGGLGPTNDDITKSTLCDFFETKLSQNSQILSHIENLFAQRKKQLNDLSRQQAHFPDKAQVIWNAKGTAPGMWFDTHGKVVISMPGVPREMKHMMIDSVIPKIQETFKTPFIYHKIIRTINIFESALAELISEWEEALPSHIKLAYLPRAGQVRMRLTAKGNNRQQIQQDVRQQIKKVMPLIKPYVFGFDQEEIEEVTARILLDKGLTISVAESCTGGYLAHRLTKIPNASQYFIGGIVVYDNSLKTSELGVPNSILEKHGAVSEEVVQIMAENVHKKYKTDIGVAISGIAGPSGGTVDKPVGTIWVALSFRNNLITRKLQLYRDRQLNIQLTADYALNKVREIISTSDHNDNK